MTGLAAVWLCALDLQLIRADRIITLMVTGPSELVQAPGEQPSEPCHVDAEVQGGSRVRLADVGAAAAAHALVLLADQISAAAAEAARRAVYVYPVRLPLGRLAWARGRDLPGGWPVVGEATEA